MTVWTLLLCVVRRTHSVPKKRFHSFCCTLRSCFHCSISFASRLLNSCRMIKDSNVKTHQRGARPANVRILFLDFNFSGFIPLGNSYHHFWVFWACTFSHANAVPCRDAVQIDAMRCWPKSLSHTPTLDAPSEPESEPHGQSTFLFFSETRQIQFTDVACAEAQQQLSGRFSGRYTGQIYLTAPSPPPHS